MIMQVSQGRLRDEAEREMMAAQSAGDGRDALGVGVGRVGRGAGRPLPAKSNLESRL